MFDFETFLKEQDLLIRAGLGHQVRINLKKVMHKLQAPRQYRAQMAQLARRVGLYSTTLRILHSIVRPEKKRDVPATDTEKLQYAAALIAVGATHEAQSWLAQINEAIEPQVLLYQGMSYFTTWDYETALPYLEKYVHSKIDDYQKLMGQINLASALVATRKFDQALQLCKIIGDETQSKNMILLNAYSLEIRSEAELWLGQYKTCRNTLVKAERALAKSGAKAAIWLKKWKAISHLYDNKKKMGFALLNEVREQALTEFDWETIRECDLFKSLFAEDENLFCQVYFGTPFLSYRERIQTIFSSHGTNYKIPETYRLKMNSGPAEYEIDPASIGTESVLKAGQLEHRLLCLLSQDFYRPYRLAQLHESLYPDQYFNPISSPRKIHELIRRAREPFSELGLSIESFKNSYKLKAEKNLYLKVYSQNAKPPLREEYLWYEFKRKLSEPHFKRKHIETLLNVSPRSAQRIISWAFSKKMIVSMGHGKAVKYSIK